MQKLVYGANLDGYWYHEDMVLQLEDVVDCLKVVHTTVGDSDKTFGGNELNISSIRPHGLGQEKGIISFTKTHAHTINKNNCVKL